MFWIAFFIALESIWGAKVGGPGLHFGPGNASKMPGGDWPNSLFGRLGSKFWGLGVILAPSGGLGAILGSFWLHVEGVLESFWLKVGGSGRHFGSK